METTIRMHAFYLCLARILPMVLLCPAFGAQIVCCRIRVILAIVLTLVIFPYIPIPPDSHGIIIILVQLIMGTAMGLTASIPFFAFQCAGEWIDINRGETLSSLLVPQAQNRSSPIGRSYLMLATTLFFSFGFHRNLLRQLAASFHMWPLKCPELENPTLSLITLERMIGCLSELLEISIRLALPVVFVLWLTDILLGICNRFLPGLNVFFIGIPMKIWIGIFLVGIMSLYRVELFYEILSMSDFLPA